MARGMHKEESLKRRRKAYELHGKNPGSNPSNSSGNGHDMRRPGSLKK